MFKLQDYNYFTADFLKKVQGLLARDRALIGAVVQHSAIYKPQDGKIQNAHTRWDILEVNEKPSSPEMFDYGVIKLQREILTPEQLVERLERLNDRQIISGSDIITLPNNPGYSNCYQSSNSQHGRWPGMLFDISGDTVHLSGETLWHPDLPTYNTPHAAIQEFMGFSELNHSDGRLGHTHLFIPNFNGKLDSISLKEHRLEVTFRAKIPLDRLKLEVIYSERNRTRNVGRTPNALIESFELEFIPIELNVWLSSRDGYVIDRHTEDQYAAAGSNPVLPKQKREPAWSFPALEAPLSNSDSDFAQSPSSTGIKNLHATIVERCVDLFQDGHYDEAIFNAMKAIEEEIRNRTGANSADIGVALVSKALNPRAPILSFQGVSIDAEREAVHSLFRGAIGTFKNPLSHRFVGHNDPSKTFEILAFASLLMRILDEAK